MATPSDRLARVIVQYEVDRASAQAVANSAQAVATTLRSVGLAANTVGAQADQLRASFAKIARRAELDKLAAEMSLAAQQGQSLDSIILKVSADLHRLDANAAEVDRLATAFDRAEKEARELAAAAKEVPNASNLNVAGGVPFSVLANQEAQRRGGGGGGFFGATQRGPLGAFGQQLFLLPDIGPTTEISRSLIIIDAVQQAIAKAAIGFGQLAAAAGIVVPAIAGLAFAIGKLNEVSQESKRRLDAALQAQDVFYKALQESTTGQVEQQIRQLEALRTVQEQQAAEARSALESAFANVSGSFGDLGARLLDTQTGVAKLREESEAANVALNTTNDSITRLTQGLEAGAFAINDMALAAEQLVGGSPAALFLQQEQRDLSRARERAGITIDNGQGQLESLQDRLRLLQAERKVLDDNRPLYEANITAQNMYAESSAQLLARLFEVDAEIQDLTNDLIPAASGFAAVGMALEQQREALQQTTALQLQAFDLLQSGTVEQVDNRIASLNAETAAISQTIPTLQQQARYSSEGKAALDAANEQLRILNQELNVLATIRPDVAARQFREESEKLASQFVKDIARIEAARDNRIAEIEANLGEKEAELAKRRSDDLTEAEEKAAARRVDALEDYREAEARINRKFNRDYLKAVSERDALAAFEAKQQRDDDLADARAKLDKQTATIDKALKDQQRVIENRYKDQIDTARAAATRAIQLERDKATAEINLRTQAYNAEIQGLQQSLFAQFALQQQFWAASIAVANRAVQQVQAQASTQRQILVPNVVYQPPPTQRPYQYQLPSTYQFRAAGGPAEGWTMVGEKGRELVYFPQRPGGQAQVINHRQTEQMMGGANVSIVIALDGKTLRATSRKEAARLLEQVLKGTGVD